MKIKTPHDFVISCDEESDSLVTEENESNKNKDKDKR